MLKEKYRRALYDDHYSVDVTDENKVDVHAKAIEWLNAKVGNAIFDDELSTSVESVDMCGGRYMMLDEHGNVAGLTFDIEEALSYIGL